MGFPGMKFAKKVLRGATCFLEQASRWIQKKDVPREAFTFVGDEEPVSSGAKTQRVTALPPHAQTFPHGHVVDSVLAAKNIDEQVAGGVCIGVGGYGNVYAVEAPVCDAQGIATGATKPLALKIVTADEGLDTEKTHELVLDETTNYIKLQGNPAVVKVHATIIEQTTEYELNADFSWSDRTACRGAVLMERAECSLEDDKRFDTSLPIWLREAEALLVLVTLLAFYLHGDGNGNLALNFDIKPANLMRLFTGLMRVGDLGKNVFFVPHGQWNTCAGEHGVPCTDDFAPGEVNAFAWHGEAAIVYAIGMTLFTLLTGTAKDNYPAAPRGCVGGLANDNMRRTMKVLGLTCVEEKLQAQGCNQGVICLLQSMLHEDPQQRATVMEVFQMAGACRAFDHFQWRRVHKNAGPELDATVNFAWMLFQDGAQQAAEQPGRVIVPACGWPKWRIEKDFGKAIAAKHGAYVKMQHQKLQKFAEGRKFFAQRDAQLDAEHHVAMQRLVALQGYLTRIGGHPAAIPQPYIVREQQRYAQEKAVLAQLARPTLEAAALLQLYDAQADAAAILRASGATVELRPAQVPSNLLRHLAVSAAAEEAATGAPPSAPAEATAAEAAAPAPQASAGQAAVAPVDEVPAAFIRAEAPAKPVPAGRPAGATCIPLRPAETITAEAVAKYAEESSAASISAPAKPVPATRIPLRPAEATGATAVAAPAAKAPVASNSALSSKNPAPASRIPLRPAKVIAAQATAAPAAQVQAASNGAVAPAKHMPATRIPLRPSKAIATQAAAAPAVETPMVASTSSAQSESRPVPATRIPLPPAKTSAPKAVAAPAGETSMVASTSAQDAAKQAPASRIPLRPADVPAGLKGVKQRPATPAAVPAVVAPAATRRPAPPAPAKKIPCPPIRRAGGFR